MTGRLLDVSTMPFEQVYTCEDGSTINMREFLESHEEAAKALAANGLIEPSDDSFGFVMLKPMTMDEWDAIDNSVWDKPEEFVWFVGGWGPKRYQCIANGVRKLRPLLRLGTDENPGVEYLDLIMSTLDMRFLVPEYFEDKVPSIDKFGNFPWGDFPWGGALVDAIGDKLLLFAAGSSYSEIEDDFFVNLITGGLKQRIVIGNKLLED